MNQERVLKTILAPLVSEKSTILNSLNNQYVFKVVKSATKKEVISSVEMLFGVKVEGVQVMNVKGKSKMFGRRVGKRANWKKAIVRLAQGQMINVSTAE
ncbi:LSU ribosomal protein L23p (L23Ae) [hydrothermal vent metagenome]|uniref:LSU ribosomal protein L23p (L23Ae) n=1 Tax=hydrothermal vent metagenome TaxID=652676 RepID=A0A1W1BKV0_9ZZZZ